MNRPLVLASGVLLVACTLTRADPVDRRPRIAFVAHGSDIAVTEEDGGSPRTITSGPAFDSAPEWSPERDRIVFIRSVGPRSPGHVMVVNADGSEPERLTRGEGAYWDAAWSPDGGRIAVTRADWEGDRIYVMDADGSDSRQLTDIQSGSPSWSPDGRFLAFDGNPEDSEADRIYRLDIETGEVHVLVEAEGTLNQCPTWSPDGRRIAFFRLTLGAAAKPITTANAELFITGPDGSARPLLSTSFSSCPTWAPDGRTVLFAAGNELRLVDVATGRVRRPAPGVLRGSDPDWA